MIRLPLPLLLLLLSLLSIAQPKRAWAAESYDNCTGFVTTLPATITTQGTWCMNQDLATGITSGSAIAVNTNNVTIDCNGFKLGGLAAGIGTNAWGIFSQNHTNVTVRHCVVRGFFIGVSLYGSAGGGHLVEDNRFDGNTSLGVQVQGDGSTVRRNLVFATGPSTQTPDAIGIMVTYSVDVLDNTVSGVTAASGGNGNVYGILVSTSPSDGRISGNRIRGLSPDGTGIVRGIQNISSGHSTMRGNDIVGAALAGSIGVSCAFTSNEALDNIIDGFASAISTCTIGADNYAGP